MTEEGGRPPATSERVRTAARNLRRIEDGSHDRGRLAPTARGRADVKSFTPQGAVTGSGPQGGIR